jgi:hypothetical protein
MMLVELAPPPLVAVTLSTFVTMLIGPLLVARVRPVPPVELSEPPPEKVMLSVGVALVSIEMPPLAVTG